MAAAGESERGAARRGRGARLLRFLYGAGLFAIGACLGVVIGSLSETPRLLLERLRGPVETIDVASPVPEEPSESAATPPLQRFGELQEGVPPAPPGKTVARPPAPEPDVAPEPPAREPQVAAAPPPRPLKPATPEPAAREPARVVQVASHVDRKPAEDLAARLRGQGFDAYVTQPTAKSGRFRVRVRPAGGQTASALAQRLKSAGYDTWTTSE